MELHSILTSTNYFEDTEASVYNIIAEYKPKLGLMHWIFNVSFEKEKSLASCFVKEKYYVADLNFNPKRLKAEIETDFDLEELVVHEMTHCNLWPIVAVAENLNDDPESEMARQIELKEEQTVTILARGMVMSKYGINVIPDSYIATAEAGWEEIGSVED